MVNFKDDASLGKTVKGVRLFCSLGVDPVRSLFQLRFAGGGNKFSQLCGFMFDSADPKSEYPRFSVAFVCKLRSKIYRQQNTNPSQWFIFKKISRTRVDVLDKKALLVNYGFDIDKFFDSDLFKRCIPQFEKTIEKGLKEAEEFANKNIDQRQEAMRYISAIKESLPLLNSSKRVNDTYFKLADLDALDREAKFASLSTADKQKALDAKLAAMKKGNERFMKRVAQNQAGTEPTKADIEDSEKIEENAKQLSETSFDQLDQKDGTVTGKGLERLVSTSKFAAQPMRVYDRKTTAYYNIIDSHIAKMNGGIGIEIDTSKPVLENEKEKGMEDTKKVDEAEMKQMTVKDLLDDINGWMKDDDQWGKAKLIINAPDGKSYYVEYVGTTDDVQGDGYFFECGKEAKMKKPAHEAEEEAEMKENEQTKTRDIVDETEAAFNIDEKAKKTLSKLVKQCNAAYHDAMSSRFKVFEYEGQHLANFWLQFKKAAAALLSGKFDWTVADALDKAGEKIFNPDTHKAPKPTDPKDLGDSEAEEKKEAPIEKPVDEELDKDIEEALEEIYK